MTVRCDVEPSRDRSQRAAAPTALAVTAIMAMGLAVAAPTPAAQQGAAAPGSAPAASTSPREFPSPEEAVEALITATRASDLPALLAILGPLGAKLVHSGDPVADREGRERFTAAYDRAHRIERDESRQAVLLVGEEGWPLPIPLVHDRAGWHFDTQAGEQQILDRRVGRNELNVIEVCRAYVQAQREYADLETRSGGKPQYAQHFMSHAGQRDGLYWPVKGDEPQSPLGPLVAQARGEGYASESPGGKPRPYYGYYYRILTRQGAHAPGGARSYIASDGRMTGGFALLAYPAVYGNSGIMTFIVNQNGIVREKNLGPQTQAVAHAMSEYDPDASWRIALDH
ncbi:MAG TPA: DUF2950 domain-containing protein [Steroidobacteraceae bacterium]|nr:DUF2950 domain-containing protein [Steroidobacteraceae bacterium]